MIPLDLLLTYLKQLDEVTLLEVLDISSEEILEKFTDRIDQRREYLEKEFELVGEAGSIDTISQRYEELSTPSNWTNHDFDEDEWN